MSERPLSVAMVSASFHPHVGGAEKQALELSVALRRQGASVRVLTRRLPGLRSREAIRGIPVRRLPCLGEGTLNSATFMVSLFFYLLIAAGSIDVIHVHLAGSPALAAILAGRLLRKRVVVKLGGGRGVGELSGSAATAAGRLKLRLLNWLKPQFAAVSRDLSDELEAFGVRGARVVFIPNGVDTVLYHPHTRQERKELRRKWGWPDGLVFLFVGRFSEEKRLPEFLKDWAEVYLTAPQPAAIALVGEGPMEAEIRSAIAGWPEGRAFIHPPTDEIWSAYGAADVFVLPSRSEGLSNALLEAMASGLGVLATKVGATGELIVDRENGLLFAPGASAQLRERLEAIRWGPVMLEDLGRRARQKAEEYSIDETARKYRELYGGRSC